MAPLLGGQELLHRETVMAVAGDPEPVESSDPETEDYFASSESLNESPNADKNSDMLRMDSTTPAWLIPNLARPVQTQAQRGIHPAFRTHPTNSNAGQAMFEHEGPLRNTNFIPPHPPMRDVPVYSPADIMPPPRVPAVQTHAEMLQQKRRISNIFRFGDAGTHAFEVSAGHQHSKHNHTKRSHAPRCKLSKNKIDQIRESFSNLNVANKIKQLAGTKRSRDKSPTEDDGDYEPARKRSNAEAHCQTCQCHAMVQDSLHRLSARHPMDPPKARRPPPPPGYIQRTRTFTVTETEVDGEMTPRSSPILTPHRSPGRIPAYQPSRSIPHEPVLTPMLCDYRQNESQEGIRSAPQRNDEALAILEGRSERPRHQAPTELKREDPDSVFTTEEKKRLREFIALVEKGVDGRAEASSQEDESWGELEFEENFI